LFEFENDWNKALLLLDYWKLSIQNSDISIFQYFIIICFSINLASFMWYLGILENELFNHSLS
jgi:hypothetical protein